MKRPEVFTGLYRRFYDGIFRYCVHRLFDRHIAEDITSDVFFRAIEKIDGFEGTEIQFRNWLYKIATNRINDHFRRTTRRTALIKIIGRQVSNEIVDCPGSKEQLEEKILLLRRSMFELKPMYQAVITLRFFENLKLTEIAEVLGSSDGTVRSQLARALAKLRKIINASQKEVLQNGR